MDYKHLKFIELPPNPKTKKFMVESMFDGTELGYIEWYGCTLQ